jgi:hypothetical protein
MVARELCGRVGLEGICALFRFRLLIQELVCRRRST